MYDFISLININHQIITCIPNTKNNQTNVSIYYHLSHRNSKYETNMTEFIQDSITLIERPVKQIDIKWLITKSTINAEIIIISSFL